MNVVKSKKGSNKAIIVMIIILVIVLLLGTGVIYIGVYNMVEKNKTENNIMSSPSFKNNNKSNNTTDECERSEGTKRNSLIINAIDYKPIIYLYPEEKTDVIVKLGNPEFLSCTYPKYEDEWKVTANPDGNLVDKKTGRNLYALYWEGENIPKEINIKEGFCVKGEDTIRFLEEKLEILGLNEREAEEFIIYWLPKMECNKYNYIRFETLEEQNTSMPLDVTPKPDSIIRIMMDWKALNEKIEIEEQKLNTPERKGFTVVEWGGSELK